MFFSDIKRDFNVIFLVVASFVLLLFTPYLYAEAEYDNSLSFTTVIDQLVSRHGGMVAVTSTESGESLSNMCDLSDQFLIVYNNESGVGAEHLSLALYAFNLKKSIEITVSECAMLETGKTIPVVDSISIHSSS